MTNKDELQPLSKQEEEKVLAEKKAYHRKYYQKNKKRLNEKQRQWRKENPDKVKLANERHWRKKAGLKVE